MGRGSLTSLILLLAIAACGITAQSEASNKACSGLPSWAQLKSALTMAVNTESTGLNLHMWATIVDRDGVVCAVAYSGASRNAQWPGSRAISAAKANTANSFSLDKFSSDGTSGAPNGLALSTANLYSATQPGGSLFGLIVTNPVNPDVAYAGKPADYGTDKDPMVGNRAGGVVVFGGGLGLYGPGAVLLGGLGLSGDTACADHRIAWRVRNNLALDYLGGVGGVSNDLERPDNIVYGTVPNGFNHPNNCLNDVDAPNTLPPVRTN